MKTDTIKTWISKRRDLSKLSVERIPINSIKDWGFTGKNLVHKNNFFFSIIGVEVSSNENKESGWTQPIILQQEVGILGFIIQGDNILLQAKTEPGNINGTQVGPSVQATVSNYERVHGGEETKFLKYFLDSNDDHYEVVSNSIQLEQGTRFLSKSNRNSILRLKRDHSLDDLDLRFRWFTIRDLLSLLEEDYLINTDARSVLVSCNWEELTENHIAFSDGQDHDIKYWLNASYYQKDTSSKLCAALEKLAKENTYDYKIRDLDKLRNWKINDVIIDYDEAEFAVQGVKVSATDREVPYWEQPLIHNLSVGKVILYCQKQDGVLKFLLNPQIIIGLGEGWVWGPSIQDERGDENIHFDGETILAECMQSDEGGRFYQSICLYQIIEVPEIAKIPESALSYWASLAEIQHIVVKNKKTTNELRSVLSLLLKFL